MALLPSCCLSNKFISTDNIESIHIDGKEVWINLRQNNFRSEKKAKEFYEQKVAKWQGKSPGTPCRLLPSLTWQNDSYVYVWVDWEPNSRYYKSNFSPYHHGFSGIYYVVKTLEGAKKLIELAEFNCQNSNITIIHRDVKDRKILY